MMRANPLCLIAWSVWLDFSRRKDFYVIVILIGLFAVGVLAMRAIGVENADAARFLLSCGLGMAGALAAVLTAMFSARVLPEEFENRTLYPLLAKPVTRDQAMAGKFLGLFSIATASLLLFNALAWLPVPKVSGQSPQLLAQAVALQIVALAVLVWLALWLSVRLQAALSAFIALGVYFLGASILDLSLRLIRNSSPLAARFVERLFALVPDFSAFQFMQRYVDGASPIDWGSFAVLALYGMAFVALFALLAISSFRRREF